MTVFRGGILASLCTFVVIAFFFVGRILKRRGFNYFYVGVYGGVIVLLVATFVVSSVGFRITQDGLLDPSRRAIYSATIRATWEATLFGTGPGTFREVMPAFREGAAPGLGVWSEAHSAPLQFALEMGIPLVLALIALWVFLALRLARGALTRELHPEIPLCGLAALLVGGIHSTVEFSLQIPGYCIVWAGLIAIGLAQSFSSRTALRQGAPTLLRLIRGAGSFSRAAP